MKKSIRISYSAIWLIGVFLLSACAVTPRVSSWDSPKRFTKAEVFNAALQAGTQYGMQATMSDRESGTMSFSRRVGDGQMVVSAQVTDNTSLVQVRTTASFGGRLALAGMHEEFIRNFHKLMFRNLNITDISEQKVNVQLIQ